MTDAGWNVLVYANDDDDFAGTSIRTAIADMRSVVLPDNCHLAVQLNTATARERYWSGQDGVDLADPVDTTSGAALQDFIDAATARFQPWPTLLILCAHSSGLDDIRDYLHAIARGEQRVAPSLFATLPLPPRWGPDPATQGFLSNPAIRQAISDSALHHVDVLAFNSCGMGMLEVAYEMRDVAGIFVASQVLAEVWPYGDIVARVAVAPGQSAEQLAAAIVASIRAEILAGRRDDSVSAFRGGNSLERLAAAIGKYAEKLIPLIATQWPVLSGAVLTSLRGVDDQQQTDVLLMAIAAACGARDVELAATAVVGELVNARIDHAADPSHPGVAGISLFCPTRTEIDLATAYADLEFRSNTWLTFLQKFQARLAADQLTAVGVTGAPQAA